MAWLRLDDGFTKHPKFSGWTPAQRWAWLEIMEYCARYSTGGRIPEDRSLMPRSTTPSLLKRAENAGWCHRENDSGLVINDWSEYNPSRQDDLKTAVETALREHPQASANELIRIVGGNRKQALDLIRRFRTGTQEPVPTAVPEPVTRARSRPVPSQNHQSSSSTTVEQEPAATNDKPAAAAQTEPGEVQAEASSWRVLAADLAGLGWQPWQVARAEVDVGRARLALGRALSDAGSNPGGFAWRLFDGGGEIAAPRAVGPVRKTSAELLVGARAIVEKTGDLERGLDFLAGISWLSSSERESLAVELELGMAA